MKWRCFAASLLILSAAPFARDAGLFASYLALNGVIVKDEIPLIPFPDLLQLYETVVSRRYLDIRLPVPRPPSRVQAFGHLRLLRVADSTGEMEADEDCPG